MKKIIFLNLIAILALFTGCREEIPEYSGTSGIYFAMSKTKGGLDDSKLDYTDNTSTVCRIRQGRFYTDCQSKNHRRNCSTRQRSIY